MTPEMTQLIRAAAESFAKDTRHIWGESETCSLIAEGNVIAAFTPLFEQMAAREERVRATISYWREAAKTDLAMGNEFIAHQGVAERRCANELEAALADPQRTEGLDDLQSEDRLHRPRQIHNIVDVLACDQKTIDHLIVGALKNKMQCSTEDKSLEINDKDGWLYDPDAKLREVRRAQQAEEGKK